MINYKNVLNRNILKLSGQNVKNIEYLKGGISEKIIIRAYTENESSFIFILNNNISENKAFINFCKTFKKLGLNVPEIYHYSKRYNFYILQDLGTKTLAEYQQNSKDRKEIINLFKNALSDLILFQIYGKEHIDFDYCYQTKVLDRKQIYLDFLKFTNFYLPERKKEIKKMINQTISKLFLVLDEFNIKTFIYRDFQPRNIILKNKNLFYIDFQSGRLGNPLYDLASFLYSGSININEKERILLKKHYFNKINDFLELKEDATETAFNYCVFMRLIQILGSYGHYKFTNPKIDMTLKSSKALKNLKNISLSIEEEKIKNFIYTILEK